jgi:formate hydrogenlyase transcriptional activator
LNVFPLELPPLRNRRTDIPQLVGFFLQRFANKFRRKIDSVQKETMELLMEYPWPGNIRELQNIIERAVVLASGIVLSVDPAFLPRTPALGDLSHASSPKPPKAVPPIAENRARSAETFFPSLEHMERDHILAALNRTAGVIDGPKGAARILNLHPNTLRSKMSKLGIDRRRHDIS